MRKGIVTAVTLVALLASCGRIGESRLNPLNWFDRSSPAERVLAQAATREGRPLIDQVQTLTASQTPGGAILRATGIAPTQGYFLGELIPVQTGDAALRAYEFRAFPPLDPTRVSTPRSREVTVALFLSNADLEGVRELRVSGARNARAVRR